MQPTCPPQLHTLLSDVLPMQGKLLRLGQLVQGALEAGRPVLACTPTVEESEALLGDLQYLQEIGILNRWGGTSRARAAVHDREAELGCLVRSRG